MSLTFTYTDTGSSAIDGITSNGAVTLTFEVQPVSWEYSLDDRSSWIIGSENSFILPEGSYEKIWIKEFDSQNIPTELYISLEEPNIFIVDNTILTPTINVIAQNDIIDAQEKEAGVVIGGEAEAGSSVSVTLGDITKTVQADTLGVYAATFLSSDIMQDAASTAVSVIAADLAGNVSDETTRTIAVATAQENSAPTSSDITITIDEDTIRVLTLSDFAFNDSDSGDALSYVMITALPLAGSLKLDAISVAQNQEISVSDISLGKLTFTPAANASGEAYSTFKFKVSDGIDYSEVENTATINVTEMSNTPPIFGVVQNNYSQVIEIIDGTTLPSDDIEILNNGVLKFGDGYIDSVNAQTGMLEQPWYYKDAEWYKLTYSNYALNLGIAVGGDGTDAWNTNGSVNIYPTFSDATVNNSGYVEDGDYGTIIYTGYITVGDTDLKVAQAYTLSQTSSFIKVTTQVTNMEQTDDATNLRIWVGTQDDYVGGTDWPTKVKGNIINGEFVAISDAADQASAVKIYNENGSILFYSTSEGVNTSIGSHYSFEYATTYQNPYTSPITLTNDGSYAMFLRLDDLAAGESQSFDWYYTAGDTSEIETLISNLAQATSVSLNEDGRGELSVSGSYPIFDADVQDAISISISSVTASQQTIAGSDLASSIFEPSNETLLEMLTLSSQVIEDASNGETLDWAFDSGNEAFTYLQTGEKLVLTYTISASDESQATTNQTVTVTINGSGENITGTAANDRLIGGSGSDILEGGEGKDLFIFDMVQNSFAEKDIVTDFSTADDTIGLDIVVFTKRGLNSGALNSAYFKDLANGGTQDANDYILYNSDTGVLCYDADASGIEEAIEIALLGIDLHPMLSAADFVVF